MSEKIRITHPQQLTALSGGEQDPSSGVHLELVLLHPLQEEDFFSESTSSQKRNSLDLSPLSKAWRKQWAHIPPDCIQRVTFNTRLPQQSAHRCIYWESNAPSPTKDSKDAILVVNPRDFVNLAILLASVLSVRCKGRQDRIRFEVVNDASGMANGAVNDLRSYLDALSKS